MHSYSKELRAPTHFSRMAPVIYRFELLVAYTKSKLYVRSPHGHAHLNLDALILHEPVFTEKKEATDF
jgi:hypothetical protein